MRIIEISNNKIIGVKYMLSNYNLQQNEIKSDLGEIGQVLNEDGTFSDYIPTQEEIDLENKKNELTEIKLYLEKMNPVANILTGDDLIQYQTKQARYLELITKI